MSPTFAVLSAVWLLGSSLCQASPMSSKTTTTAAPSNVPTPSVSEFYGPFLNTPGDTLIVGNPSVLEYEGTYYIYASHIGQTSKTHQNVPMAQATSLNGTWTATGDALPTLGAWTNDTSGLTAGLWTPDVAQLNNGSFIMYYSAYPKTGGSRCLGVAYADNPAGPFTPQAQNWTCPKGGGIGVDIIQDNGDMYILYKDGSKVGEGNFHFALWQVQPSDGMTKIPTEPVIINNEPGATNGWEGPAITKLPDNQGYILLHTTGVFQSTYNIYWAYSEKITGLYTGGGLLLNTMANSSNGDVVYRPGGPDFVGSSSTEFVFFGEPTATGSGDRRLYWGTLEYSNGKASMKML